MRISFGRLAIALLVFVAGLKAVALWRGGSGLFGTRLSAGATRSRGLRRSGVAGTAWRFDAPSGAWYVAGESSPASRTIPTRGSRKVLARPEGDAVACLVSAGRPAEAGSTPAPPADEISKVWASRFRAYQFHEIARCRAAASASFTSRRDRGRNFEALWALSERPADVRVRPARRRAVPAPARELESLLASFQSDVSAPEPAPTLTYIQKSFSDIREIDKKRPRP